MAFGERIRASLVVLLALGALAAYAGWGRQHPSADVTGAGPAVDGLFHHKHRAKAAQRELKGAGESWLTAPAWYG